MRLPFFVTFTALAFLGHYSSANGQTSRSGVDIAEHRLADADQAGGVQKLLGPGAKVPEIGPSATVLNYVRWAQASLERGHSAEAELSLEWAQARRRVDEEENAMFAGDQLSTYDARCERSLCQAMLSIGKGNVSAGQHYLTTALEEFANEWREADDFADPGVETPASSRLTGIRRLAPGLTTLANN